MQLPAGVYCVHASIDESATAVTFRGKTYEITPGVNGFSAFEDLVKQPLTSVRRPFAGWENTTVILVPKGVTPIGERGKVQERFYVDLPQAVTILGEPGSVIQGSFYFGSLRLSGVKDGPFALEGLTLGCRVADVRTGGQNVSLTVKNCRLTAPISDHLITVGRYFSGHRTALLEACTLDGTPSMNGEGSIFFVGSGDGTMKNCTVGNTPKFFGMSNYLQTATTPFSSFTVENCRFANCSSLRGFSFLQGGDVVFRNCDFTNCPTISAKRTPLKLENCRFDEDAQIVTDLPAVLINTPVSVTLPPSRRTTVAPGKEQPADRHIPLAQEGLPCVTPLDRLYANRTCYHGDFHCHSDSGGTSDGKTPLSDYVPAMQKIGLDFAAIVDHRQMRHFFLPAWDEQYLLCGTEPGMYLNDPSRPPIATKMDYTMIFPDKQGLKKVMDAFPEFGFSGTPETGTYRYYDFTPARFRALSEYVYGIGGLLSHAHPKQLMVSDDPMDYYFGDHTAIETIHGTPNSMATRMNHRLWSDLLALGCKVLTHGSSDSHGPVSVTGMTTVYARCHHSTEICNLVRSGDCAAGAVGIQMCIDETAMGSTAVYAPGKTLYVKVGDTHPAHVKPDTVYSFRLYTDRGLAYYREYTTQVPAFAFPVKDRKFYRVELHNESDGHLVALGNPIWLTTP